MESRREFYIRLTLAIAGLTVSITALILILSGNANAGQTGGFAPYARQGIVNQLNHIYGPGNSPYKVTCSEVDNVNLATGAVNDVITCHVRSK